MTTDNAPTAPTAAVKARKVDKAANGLAQQADNTISSLADRAESAARRAERVLHDGVETLRSQTQAYADAAAQKFDSAKTVARDKVRERPLTGLLAAAGVGLLLGMLIGGRRR
jgi:ElaB/YqjD/DUF883 family membrane-anchored ribosome-binding protein